MSTKKYLIFDAHAHIFPELLADKATEAIGNFYDIPMSMRGSANDLVVSSAAAGINRCLICSTATRPGQVISINDFIYNTCYSFPSMFLGFATLHQDMPRDEIFAEIDRILSLGLHGIKLHPDFQKFAIDDPAMIPVYRYIAKQKLPILFHVGDKRYDFSSPQRLAHVNDLVPNLVCIGAHFGGYTQWEDARRVLSGRKNIFFDTSSSLSFLAPDVARDTIYEMGVENFMFGTDFPMWNQSREIEQFLALGLSEQENDMIFHKNFQRIFDVE